MTVDIALAGVILGFALGSTERFGLTLQLRDLRVVFVHPRAVLVAFGPFRVVLLDSSVGS